MPTRTPGSLPADSGMPWSCHRRNLDAKEKALANRCHIRRRYQNTKLLMRRQIQSAPHSKVDPHTTWNGTSTRTPSVSRMPLRRSGNSRYIVTGTEVGVHKVIVVLKNRKHLWQSVNDLSCLTVSSYSIALLRATFSPALFTETMSCVAAEVDASYLPSAFSCPSKHFST